MFPDRPYANLEEPDTREFATGDPRGFLAQYPAGAIIDEVQRAPQLPSYLQSMVDQDPTPGKWILTGSQNLTLLASVTQSLAGRSAVLHLLPLTYDEVLRFADHPGSLDEVLFTGGYPRILDRRLDPAQWLSSYVATYLERDVRSLTSIGDLATFQRFVELCAGRTAQVLNMASLSADVGVSQPTVKAWLSILEASFIVFRLRPWHDNLGKRLIKSPKLHFYDTGLVCWLLGIREPGQLRSHPLRGPIFETWVVTEVLKRRTNQGDASGLYYFRDAQQHESDALLRKSSGFVAVEAKAGQTVTEHTLAGLRRMPSLLQSADVQLLAITGGSQRQDRTDLMVVPWNQLHTLTQLDATT